MPTIVIAHTFCASRDTRVLTNTGIFFAQIKTMRRKQKLESALRFQNENWGNHAFSEVMNLQFGKERNSLLCILELFTNVVD